MKTIRDLCIKIREITGKLPKLFKTSPFNNTQDRVSTLATSTSKGIEGETGQNGQDKPERPLEIGHFWWYGETR